MTNQSANVPFTAQVIAQDRNGDTVENFFGNATFTGAAEGAISNAVLISEINPGNPDGVEFVNVSTKPVDVSGWSIVTYDPSPTVRSTTIIPSNSIVPPLGIFRLSEAGTAPGLFPDLFNGTAIGWLGNSTTVSVLLQNAQGAIVDFATLSSSASITSPVTIPTSAWSGAELSRARTTTIPDIAFLVGDAETAASNLVVTARSSNTNLILNSGLILIGTTSNRTLRLLPQTNQFGVATIALTVSDGFQTNDASFVLTVASVNDAPVIGGAFTNILVGLEDTVLTNSFTISEVETPVNSLTLSATSSNKTLIPDANITFSGTNATRVMTIRPATNQFGSTTIFLTLVMAKRILSVPSSSRSPR